MGGCFPRFCSTIAIGTSENCRGWPRVLRHKTPLSRRAAGGRRRWCRLMPGFHQHQRLIGRPLTPLVLWEQAHAAAARAATWGEGLADVFGWQLAVHARPQAQPCMPRHNTKRTVAGQLRAGCTETPRDACSALLALCPDKTHTLLDRDGEVLLTQRPTAHLLLAQQPAALTSPKRPQL